MFFSNFEYSCDLSIIILFVLIVIQFFEMWVNTFSCNKYPFKSKKIPRWRFAEETLSLLLCKMDEEKLKSQNKVAMEPISSSQLQLIQS